MIDRTVHHISKTAEVPSFSTYEERLHPYIRSIFEEISKAVEIKTPGNNLVFRIGNDPNQPMIALAAHLDKINHYGRDYPQKLPVKVVEEYIEGAMDDCAGLGMMLSLAEHAVDKEWPNTLFFFSEMEESKGLKEHPNFLRNNGVGYTHGMGAKRIAEECIATDHIPDQVITLDTTPLFKGDSGIALYTKHWELNDLEPSEELIEATDKVVAQLLGIDAQIKIDNNTNDYLHYGEVFNKHAAKPIVSIALEPAIYPYHQKGEQVFIEDIQRTLNILAEYLDTHGI